jgi:hypothetical protein
MKRKIVLYLLSIFRLDERSHGRLWIGWLANAASMCSAKQHWDEPQHPAAEAYSQSDRTPCYAFFFKLRQENVILLIDARSLR